MHIGSGVGIGKYVFFFPHFSFLFFMYTINKHIVVIYFSVLGVREVSEGG